MNLNQEMAQEITQEVAWCKRNFGGLAISAGILFLIFELTSLDYFLADLFFDFTHTTFPLKNNFWLTQINHQWIKFLIIAFGLAVGIYYLAGFRLIKRPKHHALIGLAVLSMLLVPAIVGLLKQNSDRFCPWDIKRYGGTQEHVSFLTFAAIKQNQGRCFPAGHASAGFALLALYIVWRQKNPNTARYFWVSAFALGMVMGIGQQIRGAHFLSHTLWTAWLSWFTVVLVYFLYLQRQNRKKSIPKLYRQSFTP